MINRPNINVLALIVFAILCLYGCHSNEDMQVIESTEAKDKSDSTIHEKIRMNALVAVQDSLKLSEEVFEKVKIIVLEFEAESLTIAAQKFNDPTTKENKIKNLSSARNIDLGDVLQPRELISFNKVYSKFLREERQRRNEKNKMSLEDSDEFNAQLAEFRKKEVTPFLVDKRKELEMLLKPSDKKAIIDLRNDYLSISESLKSKQQECTELGKGNQKEKAQCRREVMALRKQYKAVENKVKKLDSKIRKDNVYSPLFSEINEKSEAWRIEIGSILTSITENEVTGENLPMVRYFRLLQPQNFLLVDAASLHMVGSE